MTLPVPTALYSLQKRLQAFTLSTQPAVAYMDKRWRAHIKHPSIMTITVRYSGSLKREDVVKLGSEGCHSSNPTYQQTAFVASMIWGYGKSGYGPRRVNNMIREEHFAEMISNSFMLIKSDNIKRAYTDFDLPWCGAAFFTKFLYFAGLGCQIERYPLMYDSQIQGTLATLIGDENVPELENADEYMRYVDLCHTWAGELKCRADAIEYLLFSPPANLLEN